VRICIQSLEKMQIRAKTFFLKKSILVSKNAEFHADFKSFEKSFKEIDRKKLLAKT
jgi:hypothetical protein